MSVNRILVLIVLLLAPFHWAAATPQIQHWVTGKGTRVYYAPTHELPLVDVQLVFDAGSSRDGAQFGLSSLTSGVLDTGAGDWDASLIAQRLENVGAVLGTGISRDTAWVSLRSLTQADLLTPSLETLQTILAKPKFAEADFEREKNRMLLGLKQREESPSDLAGIAFFEMLYGDHPYAHPKEGNLDTVEKLNRNDLEAFYKRYYVAKNAILVIVGDVDRAQAETLANQVVSGLPDGEAPAALPPVETEKAAENRARTFPSEQTHVYSGTVGVKMGDPDYFPLYVGNHILGGSGLVSRISDEVREKRGLSYSAFSYFYPFRELGPFLMGLQTRNDQADQAVQVLQKTLADFVEQGPTDKELEASKKNIVGGFVLRLDSNKKLLEQIASIAFYNLPLDYLDTFIGKVEAVTRADIQRVWKARIHPDHLQTIRVGAASGEK